MCCLNAIATGSLDTGAVHVDFDRATSSGEGSAKVPFVKWPGSDTLSVASPADEITLAVVDAV